MIAQRDSKVNISVAEDSKKIAAAAKRDSSAMKTVSILTLVFLPGTFVAVSLPSFSAGSHSPVIPPQKESSLTPLRTVHLQRGHISFRARQEQQRRLRAVVGLFRRQRPSDPRHHRHLVRVHATEEFRYPAGRRIRGEIAGLVSSSEPPVNK